MQSEFNSNLDKHQRSTLAIKSNRRLLIGLIAIFAATMGPFMSDMYLPSLISMGHAFSTTPTMLKLTISLYLLGFAALQIVYGPVSDFVGRRKVLISGLCVSLVGSIVCFYAPTIAWLLVGRFLQGAGVAACMSLARTIMRDLYSGKELAKYGSYFSMVLGIAPALAPVFGGYLEAGFGWHANFVFMLGYVVLVLLAIIFFLPESNRFIGTQTFCFKQVCGNYKTVMKSKIFWGYTICTGMAFTATIAYATLSPFLFQKLLGLSPIHYGWLAIAIAGSLLVGKSLNSVFVRYFSLNQVVMIGLFAMFLGGAAMLVLALLGMFNVIVIVIPCIITLTGSGIVFPACMSGAFTPFKELAGTAGALYGCVQISISFVASSLLALFSQHSQIPLGVCFVILGIAPFVCFKFLVLNQKNI